MTQLNRLALRLRARAENDKQLAMSKCDEPDSFMYVIGRAQTLSIIADEIESLESDGTDPEKSAVQP